MLGFCGQMVGRFDIDLGLMTYLVCMRFSLIPVWLLFVEFVYDVFVVSYLQVEGVLICFLVWVLGFCVQLLTSVLLVIGSP